MVAQETALLLDATGSAVYRFESESEATCVAAHPPAAPGRRDPAGGRADRRHGDRARRPAPACRGGWTTTATRPSDPSTGGAGRRPAQRHRRPPLDPRPAVGGADGRLGAAVGLRSRPTSGAWRRSPSSPRSPWPTPRRAPSWPTWPTPTRSPASPTAGPSRERLDGEVERARRHGHLLTLAIIDIDDFKGINDTYGHQGGDAVLAEIGRRLAATRRAGELVARIGGEEFAWILPAGRRAGRAGGRRARAPGDRGASRSRASRGSPARRASAI